MYISKWMPPSLPEISPETNCAEALAMMNQEKVRRLPVVEKDRLVGMVTLRSILALKDDLKNIPAREIMYKKLITITPHTTVMETLIIGQKYKIGAFPVVEGDRLVGLVTEVELFQALHQLLGLEESSTFLELTDLKVDEGTFGQIVSIIDGCEGKVKGLFTLPQPSSSLHRVILRFQGGDLNTIIYNLKSIGFKVAEKIEIKGYKIKKK